MTNSQILKRLERLETKHGAKKRATDKRQLPDNWLDFARLCKIRSGAKIVNFEPYGYQKTLVELIGKHHTTVIAKTRQLGITETIANYFLFKACTNDGYLAVIFSKTQSDTSNIAKRIRRQLDSLYEYIEPITDSLTDIELSNGGRILFRNSTPNGARGLESVSDILYDESAFADEIEEIYKSSIPCTTVVGKDARIVILSTPNGQSGWFWDKLSGNNGDNDLLTICENIKSEIIPPLQYWIDNNGWCKFLLHWLEHPEFSKEKETYLTDIKRQFELAEDVIQQEYNLSFTHSETVIFKAEDIRNNAIGQWDENIDKEGIYYIGVDTSLLGNDYTVCVVLQEIEEKYHLVKMYRQRKKTHEYHIYEIAEILNSYKPIVSAIEVNGSGQVYFEQLYKSCCSVDIKPIKTTAQSKPMMINRLMLFMEKGLLIYPNNKYIIEEFLSFRQNGSSLEAIQGKHDDIIMALAFAVSLIPIDYV
jgi:phage terminase large subunit-like protein